MGAMEMPTNIKDLISKYYSLIQRGLGLSDEATKLRDELNLQLGKNHPELQRADLMNSLFSNR